MRTFARGASTRHEQRSVLVPYVRSAVHPAGAVGHRSTTREHVRVYRRWRHRVRGRGPGALERVREGGRCGHLHVDSVNCDARLELDGSLAGISAWVNGCNFAVRT